MMSRAGWTRAMKVGSAAIILCILILVACTNIDPGPPPELTSTAVKQENMPEKMKTEEIFDKNKYKGLLTVHYLWFDGDVSMGDSILIQSPDGKTMLIDAGIPEAGTQVVSYLDKLGIQTIDIALNTHPHSDHIGGYATVAAKKDLKAFYMENFPYTNSSYYRNSMTVIDGKNIPKVFLEEGSTFQLGSDVKFEVMSPPKGALPDGIKSFQAAEINDFSMVFKMTYKENTFLFTADIYKHREIELVNSPWESLLKSDMVHAPHHGSESTSSSEMFVRAVSPKIAVLSQNLFVSPNLIDRYKSKSIQPFSTGMHGNVLITSDGKTMNVITEREGKRPIKTGFSNNSVEK